jgi:cytochrome P450 family 4
MFDGALTELSNDVHFIFIYGLSVCVLIYGMNYSPAVYRDPDAFKPERFLPEQSVGRHPFAFIPFNAGLRNCIGQKYGLFELKVMLSKFRFSI